MKRWEKNSKEVQSRSTKILRTLGKSVVIVFISSISIILLLVLILRLLSPGRPEQYVSENGEVIVNSISEKVFVTINGVKQGMFIEGKDLSNPILLYLHGGMPEHFLTDRYPTGLEDYFTVVWWDQRGSGISYDPNIPKESINLEQLIADTIEVTNYLRQRFDKEKIYLMAHSGGTFIGIQVAAQEPELFYAYIAVSQVSDQLKSESLAYEYMLAQYRENGNSKMVRQLEAAPVSMEQGISEGYLRLRDTAMHNLGIGTTHEMKSVITGIFIPSLVNQKYTFTEKINLWKGKSQSGVSSMWNEMISTNLANKIRELEIPVYFFEGVYDYTCSFSEAEAYFRELSAPIKGFYIFTQSAHSPVFEEPQKVQLIIQEDVLQGVNTQADIK